MRGQFGAPFLFLLGALVTWRVTAFLAYERGPFGVMVVFRRYMARIGLGRLVGCFHCLGVWVAAGMALIVYRLEPSTILLWLALAGAASIGERWLSGAAMTGGVDDG